MKNIGKILTLVVALSMFAGAKGHAQMYVKAPLEAPKNEKKPPRPNKFEIWVPGDWVYDGKAKYVYTAGHWMFPPTPKSYYIPGKWEKSKEGYHRIPGAWGTRASDLKKN